jgi:methionyl aminopeptidase
MQAGGKAILKSESEINKMRKSAELVSKTLAYLKSHIVEGIDTLSLDRIAEDYIRSNGARPAFKNYVPPSRSDLPHSRPFPYTLCVSVNDAVVHGFPSKDIILKAGDVVSVDVGVELDGYFGDSAYTFSVGDLDVDKTILLQVTKDALYLGIQQAVSGKRVGDISWAVQNHIEMKGFSVVRELVGHGIGRHLHEFPDIPNFGRRGNGMKLQEGLVLAIEPMVNMGKSAVVTAADGWTILAADGKPSAHFEHTVVVRKKRAEILTNFEWIEN